MAVIGSLGDVLFWVSSEKVLTLNNANWSGSARYAIHQRHGGNAITEFLGLDPDKFSLDIYLSAELGAGPMEEIGLLWSYLRAGTPLFLIIGWKAYGKYKWNITSLQIKMETYDKVGNLVSATVSLELQEYLME